MSELAPEIFDAAEEFCDLMAKNKMSLVYGGGREGLMGFFADRILDKGGQAHGVFPEGLFPNEVVHPDLTKIHFTKDLMERKRLMMELSDVFVVFPGGLGTVDEAIEVITWKSLGCIDKPIFLFNINGFWNSFFAMIADMEKKKVLYPGVQAMFQVTETVESLWEGLQQ